MQHSLVAMLERKSKLGESVVIADSNGNPLIISANEALRILKDTPQAGQS